MKKLILIAALAAFLLGIWQEAAQAIPAFARRYRLSCKTCHNPFPRLNAYGEEFAGNAFQLPDKEEPPSSYYDLGDEKLKLLRDFPVAARLDLHARFQPDNEETESDFRFPDRAKLLSGGAIAKDIAYYFYFYMNEHGEVAGVEDAYVHFNNLGGAELDIIAGQFQICDPLFKRELRLTYEDYVIYKQRIGSSHVNLAYDRGMMVTFSPMDGTDLVFELINGNGIGEQGESGSLDNDSFKNIFIRASQEIPGTGLRLGGFYYFARDTQHIATNEAWYWGIDGTFDFKESFTVNAQYLERRDDNPFYSPEYFDILYFDVETKGALVEVIYGPKGKDSDYYFVFLYNWIESDFRDVYDYESVAFNATYLILRNMRIFGEYARDIEHEASAFTAGLVVAF